MTKDSKGTTIVCGLLVTVLASAFWGSDGDTECGGDPKAENAARAALEMAERVAPEFDALMRVVLDTPWGAEYGVLPDEYLEEDAVAWHRLQNAETPLREELRRILNENPPVRYIAPRYGQFWLLTEFCDRPPFTLDGCTASPSRKGEAMGRLQHGYKYGALLSRRDRPITVLCGSSWIDVEVSVIYHGHYVGDLVVAFFRDGGGGLQ